MAPGVIRWAGPTFAMARGLKMTPGVRRTLVALAALLLIGTSLAQPVARTDARTQAPKPTFRTGVDVVRVTAVVQDMRGRPVVGLSRADFELFEGGEPRPIVEFRSEPTPISVAVLVDGSGSMSVAPKRALARQAVQHLLSWVEPGQDEVALLTFDTGLSVLQPFTTAAPDVARWLPWIDAFGATSLYDAIAGTSREMAERRRPRQAVVAVTDGVDTSSRLDASAVSRLASAIDVPVYVLAVAPPEAPGRASADATTGGDPAASLEDLARWTGGRLFVVAGPAGASLAARGIVTELRHQYLIGFEPNARAGWHPLSIRTRQKDLIVRARSGYVSGAPVGKP